MCSAIGVGGALFPGSVVVLGKAVEIEDQENQAVFTAIVGERERRISGGKEFSETVPDRSTRETFPGRAYVRIAAESFGYDADGCPHLPLDGAEDRILRLLSEERLDPCLNSGTCLNERDSVQSMPVGGGGLLGHRGGRGFHPTSIEATGKAGPEESGAEWASYAG